MSIRRRIQVLSLSAICVLSGAAAFGAADSPAVTATRHGVSAIGGGVTATTDGTSGGTRVRVNTRQPSRAANEAGNAARSRNSQFLRSRVEVLQKVGALRRWQASTVRGDSRQAAAIRKQNERLLKLQQDQIKRARERRKQQQSQ